MNWDYRSQERERQEERPPPWWRNVEVGPIPEWFRQQEIERVRRQDEETQRIKRQWDSILDAQSRMLTAKSLRMLREAREAARPRLRLLPRGRSEWWVNGSRWVVLDVDETLLVITLAKLGKCTLGELCEAARPGAPIDKRVWTGTWRGARRKCTRGMSHKLDRWIKSKEGRGGYVRFDPKPRIEPELGSEPSPAFTRIIVEQALSMMPLRPDSPVEASFRRAVTPEIAQLISRAQREDG